MSILKMLIRTNEGGTEGYFPRKILFRALLIMSPTSTFKTSPIRSSVSRVGFQGFVSKLLIKDWLSPAFSAKALPEIRCRLRSRIRSRTTSAQISSRRWSFDTPPFVSDTGLDCAYHYTDTRLRSEITRKANCSRVRLRELKSSPSMKDSGLCRVLRDGEKCLATRHSQLWR